MEHDERRKACYQILYLIAKTIEPQQNAACPEPSRFGAASSALLSAAKAHGLSAITAYALQKEGVISPEIKEICAKAMRKNVLFDKEFHAVDRAFSDRHIRHLPLKGVYLKDLYPMRWMREMSDIDMLIEEIPVDTVTELMRQTGYSPKLISDTNEDVYFKAPFFLIEIHRALFDSRRFPEIQAYFDQIRRKTSDSDPYLWQMETQDTYVYLIAHLYMHYQASGTGLRSLLDIRLYLRRYEEKMDFSYIEAQLKAFGADGFEKKIRRLSQRFLDPDQLSQEERKELDYFIFSGTYGTRKQYVRNRIARKSDGTARGKMTYIRDRFSVPDNQLRLHPFYAKHPKLKPLLAATRFTKAVFKKPKTILSELKDLHHAKQPPHD